MRKKLSQIFAIALILSFMFTSIFTFFGCDKKQEVDKKTEENKDIYMIHDFENINTIRQILFMNDFGKVEVNSNKDFITSGEHSMKLLPRGNYSKWNYYPSMVIYTKNPLNELNKTDFSDVDGIFVDVYNNSDFDVNILMGLMQEKGAFSEHSNRTSYVLKSKKWNKISLPFEREYLSKAFNIKNFDCFTVMFDTVEKDSKTPELYFDNFIATKTKKEIAEFNFTKDSNEIFNFDKSSDISMMFSKGIFSHFYGNASLSHNIDKTLALSGNGSLKVVGKSFDKHPYTGSNDNPIFGWEGDALKGINDFSKYKSVKFSVYNDSGRDIVMHFSIDDGLVAYGKYGFIAKANMWITFTVTMPENDNLPYSLIDSEKPDTIENRHYLQLNNIQKIYFAYNGFYKGSDVKLYIDNFQFENKGA